MATIPGVSDGELIRTTWGDAVADELNTNTVKKTADQAMAGYLNLPAIIHTAAQSAAGSASTRKDYVDGQVGTKMSVGGGTFTGNTHWNADPFVGLQGSAVHSSGTIAANRHIAGSANLYLFHSGAAWYHDSPFAYFCGQTAANTIGAIMQQGSSGVTFFSSSDYRLKDDLGPIEDPVGKLLPLQPKHLRWKVDGQEFDGFIAHEVAEVVPEAVSGDKDAVRPPTTRSTPAASTLR